MSCSTHSIVGWGRQTLSERSGKDGNLHPFREPNKNPLVVQYNIITKGVLGNMRFNSSSTNFLKRILLEYYVVFILSENPNLLSPTAFPPLSGCGTGKWAHKKG